MDYKGYQIRHVSCHRQICDIDSDGNPTELMDTIEMESLKDGYTAYSFNDGALFDSLEALKEAIDERLNGNEANIIKNFRESLMALAEDLSEKRSDVADILESIVDNNGLWLERDTYKTEARFITCLIPEGAVLAQYDTLTTEISFSDFSDTWTLGRGHIRE